MPEVRFDLDESVRGLAWITFDRPHVRNALSMAGADELVDALSRSEVDPEVRTIALTGTGGTFCAGADLNEIT